MSAASERRRDDFQRLCLATQPRSPAARRREQIRRRRIERHRRVAATWLTALLVATIVLPPMMAGETARPPVATVTA